MELISAVVTSTINVMVQLNNPVVTGIKSIVCNYVLAEAENSITQRTEPLFPRHLHPHLPTSLAGPLIFGVSF